MLLPGSFSEELGVRAEIGREVYRGRHRYAELSQPIELIFFLAKAGPAEVRNLVFEGIEWRDPKTLGELNFLPADRELIQLLADGKVDLKQ